MWRFLLLGAAVCIAGCTGSTEPKQRQWPLPLLSGAFSFNGSDAVFLNSSPTICYAARKPDGTVVCLQDFPLWVGNARGTLLFGDTIPGKLFRNPGDSTEGEVQLHLSGTLTGDDADNQDIRWTCVNLDWNCWGTNFATAPLDLTARDTAIIQFKGDSILSLSFNVTINNRVIVPNRLRPPFMRFALVPSGGAFSRTLFGLTATLAHQ